MACSSHGVATVSLWWSSHTKYNMCQRCCQTLGGDISVHEEFGSASLYALGCVYIGTYTNSATWIVLYGGNIRQGFQHWACKMIQV